MEEIIKLWSRGGNKNYLKKLNKVNKEESKTYILKVEIPTYRVGYLEDKRLFIDPSGGPMIIEGEFLEEANAVVKSIKYTDKGHIITFK